jgi:hypothetical protein
MPPSTVFCKLLFCYALPPLSPTKGRKGGRVGVGEEWGKESERGEKHRQGKREGSLSVKSQSKLLPASLNPQDKKSLQRVKRIIVGSRFGDRTSQPNIT